MDWKILPSILWICLLSTVIIGNGQRIPQMPQPPPNLKGNPPQNPNPSSSASPQPPMSPSPIPPHLQNSKIVTNKIPPMNTPPPSGPIMQQPQQPIMNQNNLNQMNNNNNASIHMDRIQKRKNDELSNVKDDNIKKVLIELSSRLSPTQLAETQNRVAQLIGPLFYSNFEQRKEHILQQGRNASLFPQRILSAFSDIRGEEVKALVLQKRLDTLHASDLSLLPMAFLYALQKSALQNISGFNLAGVVKVNRGDTAIAFKAAEALENRTEEQIEFLQSLGTKILPDAQRTLIQEVLEWWGNPAQWKDRELSLLTAAGDPLLTFLPPSSLEKLDEEQADRVVSILGQSNNDNSKVWWMKPMPVKKAWFELAKRARFFGAVQEWSFLRMQKLSFLLEGASPEDLQHIPPLPEIKGLVIGNHYTELQARVVFDAFYKKSPLSQEDLQEFQFHILELLPTQLQRFDLADSFTTLDDMMVILENQEQPSYPSLLQISYYMWPLVNTTSSSTGLVMAPAKTWQKKELSQIGKFLFLLPKSVFFDLPSELINWDSNTLHAIRSKHFSPFQIWFLTSKILSSVDERFKSDYAYLIPPPFQKGIPTENITQLLLTSPLVRPDTIRVLIEESEGMLTSQKAVITQRIRNRLQESTILRHIASASKPSELFEMFSPRLILKTMPHIIKTIMGMPEFGRFGTTAVQAKLFPPSLLSLWMRWVREQAQVTKWTAEDIVGRSSLGSAHAVQLTIMGLSCREVNLIDPLDILPVILHYRHELYALRKFNPDLVFQINLRSCFLEKVVNYLKIKKSLNRSENETQSNILSELNPGEIVGIGGEVFSLIPVTSLERLSPFIRMKILEEIGRIGMLELFRFVPLEQLQWYANTLFKDNLSHKQLFNKRRRSAQETNAKNSTEGDDPSSNIDDFPDPTEDQVIQPESSSAESDLTKDEPTARMSGDELLSGFSSNSQTVEVGEDVVRKLGNLLCFAEDIFIGSWDMQFFKDTLESKSNPGEKTCCIRNVNRMKWFELLKKAYGDDTSTWNEFHLAAIGDLLITVPEEDLVKIPRESFANAVHPIMKQSGYDQLVSIPGETKQQRFITVCAEELGMEGSEITHAYKILMRQITEGAQWLVNTVKTTEDLLKDSVGRSGRIPRWAEFTLVRTPRQIPIATPASVVTPPATPPTQAIMAPPATKNPIPIKDPIMAKMGNQNPSQAVSDLGIDSLTRRQLGNQPEQFKQGQYRNQPGLGHPAQNQQQQQLSFNQQQQGQRLQHYQQGQLGGPQNQQNQRQFGIQNTQGQQQQQQQQQFGGEQNGQFNAGIQGQVQFSGGVMRQDQKDQSQFRGQQGKQGQQFHPDQRELFNDITARGINSSEAIHKNGTNHSSSDTRLDEKPRAAGSLDTVPESVIFNNNQQSLQQITCNAIKTAGPAAIGLTIDDLQQLSQIDLFNCIEPIGKLEWDEQTKVGILKMLAQKLSLNFNKIKALHLIEIGNLATALQINEESFANNNGNATTHSPIDVSQMDLKVPESLDLISILGSKITEPQVLKVLAEKFNTDNSFFPGNPKNIRPENLRIIVQSLGNILCGFSDKVVNSIFEGDPPLFIDCSPTLGKLEGCSSEVLSTLATHAIRPSNYGPPRLWTQEDLETIGVVFAGLKPEAISTIPPQSMQGLQPQAMKALPSLSIPALTPQQISKMSFDAAKSILSIQQNSFTPAQQASLKNVLQLNEQLDAEFDEGTDADSASRPEETRNIQSTEGSDVHGRTKGKDDHSDHTHTLEAPPSSTTPLTPPPSTTPRTSTPTSAPESEGETGPKSSGSISSKYFKSLNLVYVIMLFTWTAQIIQNL